MKVLAEISVGELFDKITILNIKTKKINDQQKLKNVLKELNTLNEQANKDFGENFIKLSRDVHFKNDIRAEIKKEINLLSNSIIVEEKEYFKY